MLGTFTALCTHDCSGVVSLIADSGSRGKVGIVMAVVQSLPQTGLLHTQVDGKGNRNLDMREREQRQKKNTNKKIKGASMQMLMLTYMYLCYDISTLTGD